MNHQDTRGNALEVLITGFVGRPSAPTPPSDGPAGDTDLCYPTSLALGPGGEIYFAEPHVGRVRVLAGGRVTTFTASVASSDGMLGRPLLLEMPARLAARRGSLYVLDTLLEPYVHSRLWVVDTQTRQASLVAIPHDQGDQSIWQAETWGMSADYVWALSSSGEGPLLVFLLYRDAVFVVSSGQDPSLYTRVPFHDGIQLSRAPHGNTVMYFAGWGLALLPDKQVAISHGSVVGLLGLTGVFVLAGSTTESGYRDSVEGPPRFSDASGLVWDERRHALLVADSGNHAIRSVTLDGQVSTIAGNGDAGHRDGVAKTSQFYFPSDLCLTQEGEILVADSGNNLIRKIDADGKVTTLAGTGRRYFVPIPYPGYRIIE